MRYSRQARYESTLPDEKSFITGNIHTAPAMIIIIPNMLLPFSESSPATVTLAFFTSKYARTLITAADIISSTFSTVLNASQPLAYRSEGYSVQETSCMDSHYSEYNGRNRLHGDSFYERKTFHYYAFQLFLRYNQRSSRAI